MYPCPKDSCEELRMLKCRIRHLESMLQTATGPLIARGDFTMANKISELLRESQ